MSEAKWSSCTDSISGMFCTGFTRIITQGEVNMFMKTYAVLLIKSASSMRF